MGGLSAALLKAGHGIGGLKPTGAPFRRDTTLPADVARRQASAQCLKKWSRSSAAAALIGGPMNPRAPFHLKHTNPWCYDWGDPESLVFVKYGGSIWRASMLSAATVRGV